jgi:hypothetical protein
MPSEETSRLWWPAEVRGERAGTSLRLRCRGWEGRQGHEAGYQYELFLSLASLLSLSSLLDLFYCSQQSQCVKPVHVAAVIWHPQTETGSVAPPFASRVSLEVSPRTVSRQRFSFLSCFFIVRSLSRGTLSRPFY